MTLVSGENLKFSTQTDLTQVASGSRDQMEEFVVHLLLLHSLAASAFVSESLL